MKTNKSKKAEILHNALGEVSDEKIAEADADYLENQVYNQKSASSVIAKWRLYAPLAAACFIIVAAIVFLPKFANTDTGAPVGEATEFLSPTVQTPEPVFTEPEIGDNDSRVHYRLTINSREARSHVSRAKPYAFYCDIPYEQLFKAVPHLEYFFDIKSAIAYYKDDGVLAYIEVEIIQPSENPDEAAVTHIKISPHLLGDYYLWDDTPCVITDVFGANVVAWAHSPDFNIVEYYADFQLNGVYYRIQTVEFDGIVAEDNQWLSTLVNEIIWDEVIDNLTADLSVFDNPEMPLLLNEHLTLEQARSDVDFGAFLPKNIISGLKFSDATRFANQEDDYLQVCWETSKTGLFILTVEKFDEKDEYFFDTYIWDRILDEKGEWNGYPDGANPFENYMTTFTSRENFAIESLGNCMYTHKPKDSGAQCPNCPHTTFGIYFEQAGIVVTVQSDNLSQEQIWEMIEHLTELLF